MKMTQLSVSSARLAAVLSGCSQQVAGGSQIYGGSQVNGGSQQVAGGSQVGASQQQVEKPVVMPVKNVYKPKKHKVTRVYRQKPKPHRSVQGLPVAKPGQCFAKVKIPAKYVTKSRRIFTQKASVKRVLVRAPQYRWVNKKVLVRKASYKTRVIPAQYKTLVNRVMVKPAYNTWRKGHGAITRIDNMTGEIMCRVTIPAVYKTVQKRVLVRPAKTLRTLIPAVYKTVKQKQRVSGAIYKTIQKPARYKTQNYRVKVGGAKYVWRAVLCKTNAPKKHYSKASKKSYRKAPRQYRKPVARSYHRPAVRNYRKAAPRRQYRAAPKPQYRRAAVVHRPVVRSTNYRRQYNQSGINYGDYLRVMNAGSGRAVSNYQRPRKVSRKSVRRVANRVSNQAMNRKVSYRKTVHLKKNVSREQSRAETRRGIVFGIQKALKAKGFDPGAMDGKMGAGTAAALKAFQSAHGLPVGKLSKETFRALGMIR